MMKMLLIIFWVSYLVINVVDSKLVIQENEWPTLTREQIVAEADIIAEFEEKDNCKYRKVRIHVKMLRLRLSLVFRGLGENMQ